MGLDYSVGRNLSKMVFFFSGIAISTFAMGGFILTLLDFPLGIEVRNFIALSLLIPIFLMRGENNVLVPYRIPFIKIDKSIRKWSYIEILALVGLSISTIEFALLEQLLNIKILNFELLAIRNLVAAGLLWAVKVIHLD